MRFRAPHHARSKPKEYSLAVPQNQNQFDLSAHKDGASI